MAAWRKSEVDAGLDNASINIYISVIINRRERQRDWESFHRPRKLITCEATPLGLEDEPKEPVRARHKPRPEERPGMHAGASRRAFSGHLFYISLCFTRPVLHFILFSSVRSAWGEGGGTLPDFLSFCYLFPVQQTTSEISHHIKWVFRVGNQYAECWIQQHGA